jgi:fructose-bisphosphate aldolase class II
MAPVALSNCSVAPLVEITRCLGEGMDLEVAVHLDHGASLDQAVKAIRAGFTSVMYDGSSLPIAENIKNTKQVVEIARYAGVTVEAEVGALGQQNLTDPDEAVRLAETGIDCIAVAIGNAHGWYKGECRLDFDRLGEIVKRTNIPIVLHGGTGIPRDQIQQAITMGIAKVHGTPLEEFQKHHFEVNEPTSLLGKFAEADDVANLIVYLCSPASTATRGAVLRAEGGTVRSD